MPLGLFDLLILAVGASGYAVGRSQGLAWQVSGIVTLLGGALCATALADPVATALQPSWPEGLWGRLSAWLTLYVAVATSIYVLTQRFKKRLEDLELGELDKRFGGLLGAGKALVVFAVLSLGSAPLLPGVERAVAGSVSGRGLRALVDELGMPEADPAGWEVAERLARESRGSIGPLTSSRPAGGARAGRTSDPAPVVSSLPTPATH